VAKAVVSRCVDGRIDELLVSRLPSAVTELELDLSGCIEPPEEERQQLIAVTSRIAGHALTFGATRA
jgi:hypothetical protein